jgi:outer membrane lipoprotein-sorting protein
LNDFRDFWEQDEENQRKKLWTKLIG